MGAEVSVCMPVFNAERYLPEAIETILSQTFTDFEFLILDDASTDGSLALARRYAQRDRRIRVFSFEHRGYPALLNEGLALATGRYLARMDADDAVRADRLERQVDFLRAHRDCVAVGSQAMMIDSDGDVLDHTVLPTSHEEIDRLQLGGRYQMAHASIVMLTEVMRRVGGYRPEFEPAEDYDLLLRLAEIGKLANIDEPLYSYRMHPTQITVLKYERQQAAMREAQILACGRRGIAAVSTAPLVHRRPAVQWQLCVVWAECALRSGHLPGALKYAKRAVRMRPWSRTAWKVLATIGAASLSSALPQRSARAGG